MSAGDQGAGRQLIARWRPVFAQSARDLWANNAPEWAAALSFYAVLSLFPLLIAGVVVVSYIGDPVWAAERFASLVEKFLPRSDVEVRPIVEAAITERRRAGVLALLVFLFTGRRVLGALTTALNLFTDADERGDSPKRHIAVEFGLFAGVAALFLLALLASPLIDQAWRTVSVLPAGETLIIGVVVELVQVMALVAILTTIYAFVPAGRRSWRAVLLGAAVAALLFYSAQGIFLLALDVIVDTLQILYGPLASAAVLFVWTWYVALITLVGGAVASHAKVMVVEGHSRTEAARRHVPRKPATDAE